MKKNRMDKMDMSKTMILLDLYWKKFCKFTYNFCQTLRKNCQICQICLSASKIWQARWPNSILKICKKASKKAHKLDKIIFFGIRLWLFLRFTFILIPDFSKSIILSMTSHLKEFHVNHKFNWYVDKRPYFNYV